MESVTAILLLKSGELTSRGGIPSEELFFSREENDFGNILDPALARRFFLRLSSKTYDSKGHVS